MTDDQWPMTNDQYPLAVLDREAALALMHEYTASDALRKHMYAVELAMRAMAEKLGADAEPDREPPAAGVKILSGRGLPVEAQEAILGHAAYTGVPRTTPLAKALFAVDELCGFLVACALVRPSRSLADLEVPSVRKKLKDKAFARGVSREDVYAGALELGLPLDELIGFVLAALRPRDARAHRGGAEMDSPRQLHHPERRHRTPLRRRAGRARPGRDPGAGPDRLVRVAHDAAPILAAAPGRGAARGGGGERALVYPAPAAPAPRESQPRPPQAARHRRRDRRHRRALPGQRVGGGPGRRPAAVARYRRRDRRPRSEEHTSELQSLAYLVCRLLLE